MSYEELKTKYDDFVIFKEENNKGLIEINIEKFKISKYKNYHIEFIQYIVYIFIKVKNCNRKNNNMTTMRIYLKGAGATNFSPLFLKKVTKPFNELVIDEDEEVLDLIFVYNLNKYMKYIWSITKNFYDPITVKKFRIIKN